MALAISATGTPVTASAKSKTTTINPSTVGNLFVLQINIESGTSSYAPSAVSGGNCTWTEINDINNSGTLASNTSMWLGNATATGSSTVTITSTAGSTVYFDLIAQQFTCTGVSSQTIWTIGSTSTLSNASNATVTFPTLTPTGPNELYVGSGCPYNTGSSSGQTSGYTLVLDPIGNQMLYNTSVSTVQSPTTKQSSAGVSQTVGALIYANNPGGNPSPLQVVSFGAMNRASFY